MGIPRQIFEVFPRIVDASGGYSIPSGYPKKYDSHIYSDDVDRALLRAKSDAYTLAAGFTGGAGDTRQLQCVTITTADGALVEKIVVGAIADLPDPS